VAGQQTSTILSADSNCATTTKQRPQGPESLGNKEELLLGLRDQRQQIAVNLVREQTIQVHFGIPVSRGLSIHHYGRQRRSVQLDDYQSRHHQSCKCFEYTTGCDATPHFDPSTWSDGEEEIG
jgi:hypothetical protein